MKDSTLRRLTQLIGLDKQLKEEENPSTSQLLGEYLRTSGNSIRQDLHQLNPGGDKKSYGNKDLGSSIRRGLRLTKPLRTCLIGLDYLGQHMMEQMPSWPEIELTIIFDTKVNRLERMDSSIPAYPAWEIPERLNPESVDLAILATSGEEAEKNAQRLEKAGVSAVLNLSGYYLNPAQWDMDIENVNLLAEMLYLQVRNIEI